MMPGRHVFWNAPPAPFPRGGRLQLVPLRTGGRQVGLAGSFLGQAPAPANRLLALPIPTIIYRVSAAPIIQKGLAFLVTMGVNYKQPTSATIISFPTLSAADQATLQAIAQNPTPDELSDVALIDSFFGAYFQNLTGHGQVLPYTTSVDLCENLAGNRSPETACTLKPTNAEIRPGDWLDNQMAALQAVLYQYDNPMYAQTYFRPDAEKFLSNKFWCTSCAAPYRYPDVLDYYPADPNATWGTVRQQVLNGKQIMDAVARYPFPPPIDMLPTFFLIRAKDEITKMMANPSSLDPEMVNYWITLAVLSHYNDIMNDINAYEKQQEKNAKRRAIITTIEALVASIVVAIIAPEVISEIVSVAKAAMDAYLQAQQRMDAAKAMSDAAKLFEADAPAFAAQVQKTADMVDASTAEAQATKPLTPEQQAAVQQVKASVPGPPTGTIVAGGLAAGGIVAALVALLR